MTFKSIILGDLLLPPYLLAHLLQSFWTLACESQLFFHLLLKLQIKKLTLPLCSASKTTFRTALFTNKYANFIKNYENKLHLLRQNGITSSFFSNLNCFLLIIDTLNKKSNIIIVFSIKNYP